MSTEEITIVCQVFKDGLPYENCFVVTIESGGMVFDLVNAIKSALHPYLDHIPAFDILYWKAIISHDEKFEESIKAIRLDVTSDTGVQMLNQTFLVSDYFSQEELVPDHIHLLVQVPGHAAGPNSTRSLRKQYLDRNPACPPSAAAHRQYEVQKLQNPRILCNRPPELTSIPVVLLHPIFGAFVDNCRDHVPTPEDYAFAHRISYRMSDLFREDSERPDAFIQIISNGMCVDLDAAQSAGTYSTGGHATTIKGETYLLLEVRNELGGGAGDPVYQSASRYLEYVRNRSGDGSVLPCLHIYCAGPFVGIAGSAFTDIVHFDVLSPVIPLAWNQHDIALKQLAARVFGALRIAVRALEDYYQQEHPSIADRDLRFPYPREFKYRNPTPASTTRTFHYQESISHDRLIFSAVLDPPSGEKATQEKQLVIIKFVHQYSDKAHDYCAAQGYSPRLLGYEALPGGWHMVVMEAIDLNVYKLFPEIEINSRPLEKLRPAVYDLIQGLHTAGYVHGDLRDINMFVAIDQREPLFKLIDFDWAGKTGEVRYPANVNRADAMRPEGAIDGELIKTAHDMEMLGYFLS